MAKISQVLVAALLCLGTLSSAQNVCPPEEILAPCTCLEATKTIQCSNIAGRFSIKQIFDNVSPLIDDQVVFDKLIVSSTSLIEFPSKAIEHLKFVEIEILNNANLEYIYKDAFVATLDVTKVMKLNSNHLTNSGAEVRDIYEFINQFVHLETLSLNANALTSVPANAFDALVDLKTLSLTSSRYLTQVQSGAFNLPSLTRLDIWSSPIGAIPDNGFGNLPSLERMDLDSCNLTYIGKEAFANSPKLNNSDMAYNSLLTEEGFHIDAFKGITPGTIRMDLRFNKIGHLNKEVFGTLLNSAHSLRVGGTTCNRNGCNDRYLYCDERINWVCDNAEAYESIMSGYKCYTIGGLIWDYCATLSK